MLSKYKHQVTAPQPDIWRAFGVKPGILTTFFSQLSQCLASHHRQSLTRMHSSRMRTARSLTVSRSRSIRQGGGMCATHTPRHACPLLPHTPPPAMHAPCHTHPLPHTPPPAMHIPPVNRITDRCKNITLPQLRCGR